MAHDGNAVGLGGYSLLELGSHLCRIPVGPHVFHIRSRIFCRLESTVINDSLEAATWCPTWEEYDFGAGAPSSGCRCRSLCSSWLLSRGGGRRWSAACDEHDDQRERQQGICERFSGLHLSLLLFFSIGIDQGNTVEGDHRAQA